MKKQPQAIPVRIAALPVVALLVSLTLIVVLLGADAVNSHSMYALFGSGVLAIVLSMKLYGVRRRRMMAGLARSARQMVPCLPLLMLIAMISTTWMLSGVVPYLVNLGISLIRPALFLPLACICCAIVSTLTGSSWTTIATVGVAFFGIGSAFGYNPAWAAGAIISGSYFGDKFSPLSDTTVIASATTGVEMFTLIRHLFVTTFPAFGLACIIFFLMGLGHDSGSVMASHEISQGLHATFNLTPWVLVVPGVTILLIVLRLPTLAALALSSVAGMIAALIFQPQIFTAMGAETTFDSLKAMGNALLHGINMSTGSSVVDDLTGTGGIFGMIPTMLLIMGAMVFGGAMLGSGFLDALTRPMSRKLLHRRSVVTTTVVTGVSLNALTADQYVSIIIGGSVFKNVYRRAGLEPRLLGRTIQDTVPVTSVLIPWNSCGVTQTAVLGVSTWMYMPFCFFNILSPISSVVVANLAYYRARRRAKREALALAA